MARPVLRIVLRSALGEVPIMIAFWRPFYVTRGSVDLLKRRLVLTACGQRWTWFPVF